MSWVYERRATIPEILADLEGLKPAVHRTKNRTDAWWGVARWLGTFFVIWLLFAAFSGPYWIKQLTFRHWTWPVGVLTPGALMLLVILRGWLGSRPGYSRLDLVERVLARLETDAVGMISVRLDLRHPRRWATRIDYAWMGKWTQKIYLDPWLELRASLADGTKLLLLLNERYRYRSRLKKGNLMTKARATLLLRLVLRVKTKRYPRLERLAGTARQAIKLPYGPSELKGHEVTADRLEVKAIIKSRWDGDSGAALVSSCLLSLYQVLNLSRRLAPKA